MKRSFSRFAATFAGLVLAAVALLGDPSLGGAEPLQLAMDWFDGFTGHGDNGLMATVSLATGGAAGMTAEVKEKISELVRTQKEQFEKLMPRIEKGEAAGDGVADLKEQVNKASNDFAEKSDQLKELVEKANQEAIAQKTRLDEFESKFGSIDKGGMLARGDMGSAVIKALEERHGDNPEVGFEKSFEASKMEAVKLAIGNWLSRKDAVSGDGASFGDAQDSLRIPGIVVQPETALTVQDLIPRTPTSSRTIDYVRESGFTNAAAVVAENTDADNLTAKPESALTAEIITDNMTTIAHWIPASRQILKYANRLQLASYINTRLRYGVNLALETQVLSGDGTGNNLEGLLAAATAYNRGYDQLGGADATIIDTIRRGITQVRLAEYPATGVVLSPAEIEKITLLKGTDLHYIWASPGQANTLRPWGLSVAESTQMNDGEFLIGAFALAAELFIGEEVSIRTSDQHGEYFTANMVAILAEMDALLATYRPEALVTGNTTS